MTHTDYHGRNSLRTIEWTILRKIYGSVKEEEES
jgi:hypothetical protein